MQRLFDGVDAKARFHRDRHAPTENTATEPVDDRGEIDEALGHRDVGDVHRPDLVGTLDFVGAQQVRIDRLLAVAPAGVGLAVQCFDAHPPHQPLHRTARHGHAFAQQLSPDLAHAVNLKIFLPDPADMLAQSRITPRAGRLPLAVRSPRSMRVVRRRGDRQHLADRLDPVSIAMPLIKVFMA
jgi:hypothetical protein